MRAQLYHFASRDLPFKAPGEQLLRYPQKISKEEWLEVMLAQWIDLKAHLTIAHEMVFNYAQASFKVHEPNPMGRQGQNEVRLKPVVLPQPKVAATDGKVKQKRKNALRCTSIRLLASTCALPSKTAKSSVLKRCMIVADLVKLSTETKAFLKASIVKDKKF